MDPGHVTWVAVADGDDAVIQGSASSATAGVKGIALAIRGIPDDLDVILPACTGIVLTHESAPPAYRAPWPLQWEAGLVILQGDGEGFAVMADGDPIRFKEIEIVRRDRKWQDDGARKKLVQLFEAWGPADDATVEGRKRLSTVLFS